MAQIALKWLQEGLNQTLASRAELTLWAETDLSIFSVAFLKTNFTKFLNRYVKMLGGRFYSPSLKDVARIKRAQLSFLIFHSFVCKFGRVEAAAREKIKVQTNV